MLGGVFIGEFGAKVRVIIRDEGVRIFLAGFLDLCCGSLFLRGRVMGLVARRRIM